METLWQDIRYGVRMLMKRPAFTAVVVLALALGIGANTAIFSVVDAVLLRPLPYQDPARLVWIWESNPTGDIKEEPASLPNFTDWRNQSQTFEDMAAFVRTAYNLTSTGEPERIATGLITADLFALLGVEPIMGRKFMPEEDKPGNNRVVVLSYEFWQRRFGADPSVLGAALTLNGNPFTVIGIMPPGFKNPNPNDTKAVEMWVPLARDVSQAGRRSDYLDVVARLKPGVSINEARAEMETIASRLAERYPDSNQGWTVVLLPLHERFVGDVRPALLLLMGMVGFLLLIACANVANLLLARSAARQQEITIRTALGARRGRLIRQFLTESLMLALAGGALGLLLALWGIEVLIALSPSNIPRMNEVGLNGEVLVFTLAVSLVTGVVFGLVPAVHATNPNLSETLKEAGRSHSEGIRSGRIRNSLVVLEIALALVLLIGAGLMIKSFLRLQDVDPGFDPDRVLAMELSLPRSKYQEGPQVAAFFDQFLGRVAAQPGVQSAAAINTIPLSGGASFIAFVIEGRPEPPPEQVVDAQAFTVSHNYFSTMGIGLLKGSEFKERYPADAPLEIIINEAMVRRYWPDEDPIGKRINYGNPQSNPWYTIVGIVENTKQIGLEKEHYPQMYVPYSQNPSRSMAVMARAASDPLSLVAGIRGELVAIDKDQPLSNTQTMEQVMADSMARPRFNMLLIAILACVGLMLASVGIYGVISYSVTQRTHEIGVRVALGARPGDILRLVVGQGMMLTLVGIGTGLALAFALGRVMVSLLYNVTATDPVTFLAIPFVLGAVALAASYIPARRAAKVDPMVALRYE